MSERLANKVAVVTGAGSGIGRATAHMFSQEGANVVVADLSRDDGAETVDTIRSAGGNAHFIATDVTDEHSVAGCFAHVLEEFGHLEILHNCAGGSDPHDGPIIDVSSSTLDATLAIDLRGSFSCAKHAIPLIAASGGGSVINMSSFMALRGPGISHAYVAAKGAIISLTRALASTYASQSIRVNAICPGIVLTDRIKARGFARDLSDDVGWNGPKPKWSDYPFAIGEPADIASIALFLASDDSRMITGAAIPADGGLSAY